MRTKLLLTAALVAAGIATSMAQPVYSVNVVGYVNKVLPGGGYACVTPPLSATDMKLSALMPNAPDFTTVLLWNTSISDYDTYTKIGGWVPDDPVVGVGIGMLVNASETFTNTFVGDVLQGTQTNNIPAGYSLRGSMFPQAGTLTALGLTSTLADFDTVLKWNPTIGATGDWDTYTMIGGGWVPEDPTLEVGEALLISAAADCKWIRTFTVN